MARILIVDDNPLMLRMLQVMVTSCGYEAETAGSGAQALELIARQPPDLVLLDWMMPGLDGEETLRRLRARPEGRDLPVIVVTASADPNIFEKVARAGGDRVLHKPVSLERLARTIAEHLRVRSPSRRRDETPFDNPARPDN